MVGASGIVGRAAACLLLDQGWTVFGLARRPTGQAGVKPVAADLQDASQTAAALAEIRPDAVFIATWSRQATEAENIRVNAAMVRNLLAALRPAETPRHVALVTGLKHYLGPFEAYGQGVLPVTPFRENKAGSTSRISITRRRTNSSPRRPATVFHGACTGRTRSSAKRSATP